MAISAYEIRVIVSAQDHFSSAFRRINNDLRGMARMQAHAASETSRLNKEIAKTQRVQKDLYRQAESMRRGGKLHTQLMTQQARTAEKLTRQEERLTKATAARDRITKKSLPAARLALERSQKAVRVADEAVAAAQRPTKAQLSAIRSAQKEEDAAAKALRRHVQNRKQETIARRVGAREALKARRAELQALQGLEERSPEAERAKRADVRQAVHRFRSARAGSLALREEGMGARERLIQARQNVSRTIAEAFGQRDLTGVQETARLARAQRTQARANIRQLEADRTAQNADLQKIRERITATKALQAAQKAQATSMFQNSRQLKAAAREAGLSEKELTNQLVKQQAQMQKLTSLERTRQRIQAAGHTARLATMAGGIGLALGAGLANYAADFQKQIALAATQTPGTTGGEKGIKVMRENTQLLGKDVLEMSKNYGIATQEITKSSYDIYSSIRFAGTAPAQFAQGLDMLKLSAMAAVAGMTDMQTASKAVIILANQFGSSMAQVSANLDTAFAIVKLGNLTFEQFTSMMTKVGSAAARAGYSLQDVAGIMVFLTKKSGKPDEAATWIDRMLQALQTPEFVRGMRLLHAPIDKDGKLKPLSEVMDQILRLGAAAGGKGGIGMQNIIPYITSVGKHGPAGGAGLRSTIQAQRGLTFSLQDVGDLKQAQKDVLNNHGEFMRSFLEIYNSAGYKWQRQLAGFKVALLELGNALLPIMTKIVGYILYFVQVISNASPHTKKLAATIFAVGSALLFIGGILGSVLIGIGSLVMWFKILGVSGEAVAGGTFVRFVTMLGKIGAVAAVVTVALQGLYAVYKDFSEHDVKGNKLQKGIRGILDFGKSVSSKIAMGIPVPGLKQLWDKQYDLLLGQPWLAGTATTKKKKAVSAQQKYINDFMTKINKAMKDAGVKQKGDFQKQMTDALNTVLNQTKTPDKTAEALKKRTQDIASKTKEILDQAIDGLVKMYDEKKQQNEAAFGEIFTGPVSQSGIVQWRKQFGMQMSAPELLRDLGAQLKQFGDMRSRIATLRKRGLSEEIIKDVQARGAEAPNIFKALEQATPKQIQQFNRYMGTKKKDITKATEIDFDVQLKKWMSFGASAALKIAAGMESEEHGVQTRLNDLAHRLWSGVAKSLATQQINLEFGVLPPTKSLPKPAPIAVDRTTPSGATAYAATMGGIAYAQRWEAIGAYYRNIVPSAGYGPGTQVPPNDRGGMQGPGAISAGDTYNYNINGTFLTSEQMMANAVRQGAFKTKKKRR